MGGAAFLASLIGGVKSAARQLTALGWACLLAGFLLVLLVGTCSHYTQKDAKRITREAEAHARALEAKGKADDTASEERLWDFTIIYSREKERTDAVSSLPDAVPSARRVALACERLRQQSTPEQDLPAQCRSGG